MHQPGQGELADVLKLLMAFIAGSMAYLARLCLCFLPFGSPPFSMQFVPQVRAEPRSLSQEHRAWLQQAICPSHPLSMIIGGSHEPRAAQTHLIVFLMCTPP